MKLLMSVLTISLFFAGCTKNNDVANNTGNNTNSTTVAGNFIISKFTDSNPDEDKTSNFSGYTFVFTTDGKITALINNTTTEGNYSKKPAHEGEASKLTVNFNTTPLNELNKTWQVNLIADSAIHLSDDDNATEVLEFTAN